MSEASSPASVSAKGVRPVLRYFDEILPIERRAIAARRKEQKRREPDLPRSLPKRAASVDSSLKGGRSPNFKKRDDARLGGPSKPDLARLTPRPDPCDATGLALSGGGIRSAAYCLGALQALDVHRMISGLDYLSTVSGGGYIGCCLTVGMSKTGQFPFQKTGEPRDTESVGHIRNYSNYLMPRSTTGLRNVADAALIIARGILANFVLVAAVILFFAAVTAFVYPTFASLRGSFFPCLVDRLMAPSGGRRSCDLHQWFGMPFALTLRILLLLLVALLAWVIWRSSYALRWAANGKIAADNDATSPFLSAARLMLAVLAGIAFLDLLPVLLITLHQAYTKWHLTAAGLKNFFTAASAFVTGIAAFSGKLGLFFKVSQHDTSWPAVTQRALAAAGVWLAAIVLPLLLVLIDLHVTAWTFSDFGTIWQPFGVVPTRYLWRGFALAAVIGWCFKPNSYSLHQFYRDRLSKAFLFKPDDPEKKPQDGFKLSHISETQCPYHIINAAMNIQGSRIANQRGREADFFTFTRDFVGSDLTLYAASQERKRSRGYLSALDMEHADPMLDLATAMAISGAAVSANMGSSTIRPLSPTLALLNVRLGYWLRNPRDLAKPRTKARRLGDLMHFFGVKFYLLLEMLNWLDEEDASVYLTDGGHIENLGIYQLLKRGCQFIIAIDAECDPSLAFPSLAKMARYARIDLGIRIDLPCEKLTQAYYTLQNPAMPSPVPPQMHGPHCAVGLITYPDNTEGILLYFKSCLTGDEPEYVLEYKQRNPEFPHETTGDQFFSEEQFEAYRALGFHAVDRTLRDEDTIAVSELLTERQGVTQARVLEWIRAMVACA